MLANRGAVGQVSLGGQDTGRIERGAQRPKPLDLQRRVIVTGLAQGGVGGSEVGEHPGKSDAIHFFQASGDLERRIDRILHRHPEPSHPRVDLELNGNLAVLSCRSGQSFCRCSAPNGNREPVPHRQRGRRIRPRNSCRCAGRLDARHHQDLPRDARLTQLDALVDRGYRERFGADGSELLRNSYPSVAVRVRLDDAPNALRSDNLAQAHVVSPQRPEVNLQIARPVR